MKSPAGVYLVTGAGLVKIGITNGGWRSSMEDRLFAMQTGSPVPLRLHRFIVCEHPKSVEKSLHARFAASRDHGEWFAGIILEEIDGFSDEQLIAGALVGTQADLF